MRGSARLRKNTPAQSSHRGDSKVQDPTPWILEKIQLGIITYIDSLRGDKVAQPSTMDSGWQCTYNRDPTEPAVSPRETKLTTLIDIFSITDYNHKIE
jgi:hypothetical protein